MAIRSPMEMLRKKAKEQLDDTTRQLGETRQNYEKACTQLRQLESYQHEYQHQLSARTAETGLLVSHIQSYQSFIDSLSQVVRQYSGHVIACEHAVNQAQSDWKSDHLRLNAFTTLISRAEAVARQKENRLEQKLMDEFASQASLRNKL
ncbi:flagellar export protein FliJ [Pantoea anthophila]|uniref:flagellar export protein FliJ n=1 Tax=Pantoea anthophila TaxID=470931 RepID=UPI00278A1B67|nr:flagellar export protein FliJ [Pantoea anthophila]MDQ1213514.1 flagellar FliJ protein [Pantoea anthophila]